MKGTKIMKTYTKTTIEETPCLSIRHDDNAESPRTDTNLGYFISMDSNRYSPDKHEVFESIISDTGDIASSKEEHMKMIKKEIEKQTDEKVLAIYSIVKYEHSSVSYKLGSQHGFDYCNNSFYIITKKSQKEIGANKKDWNKIIKQELETYNKYVNGEVYQFVLYNDKGEVEDSCGGFYDIEDIREYLPKEWKNEDLSEYINE